jgi:hypothetical protein
VSWRVVIRTPARVLDLDYSNKFSSYSFQMKEKSSYDRLSIFGLMVKPVQRFPQFIMLLQVWLVNYNLHNWLYIFGFT